MPTFGEKLVSLRKQKNLSQKELAEIIGVTATRLNYWEKDKRKPGLEWVKKLTDALGIPTVDLMDWDTELNPDGRLAKEVRLIEEIQLLWGKDTVNLLSIFDELNDVGKEKALDYLTDLSEQSKYKK
jgi:transcriptional regulator with XRE-family HTH domain